MPTIDHLALEQEIVAELAPLEHPANGEQRVRRETVLAILSRSAQSTTDFCELLNESGLLVASALEMEFFGHAQLHCPEAFTMGWGSVTEGSRNLDPVASEVTCDSKRSALSYAMEVGHPVLVGNVGQESRFHDEHLLAHGICSGAIWPIIYGEQQYGAIGVFSRDPRTPSKDDVLFLQSVASLLGAARAHQKAEQALSAQSRFLSSAIDALDAIVVLLDASGAVLQINRACQICGGFTTDQLRGRKLWSAFFLPAEEAAIRTLIQEVGSGLGQRRCEAFFLSKHGERRRVSWTVNRLPIAAGDATFLATGIDITDQFNAILKLEEMTAAAAEAAAKKEAGDRPQTKGESESLKERRRHDRRPYSCVQSIAPCLEGSLPARRHFREVRCQDISPRGFSFILDSKPEFNELVVAFGSSPSQLFLRARVIHISSFRSDGRYMLKIGCEYLGRVKLPWVAAAKNS